MSFELYVYIYINLVWCCHRWHKTKPLTSQLAHVWDDRYCSQWLEQYIQSVGASEQERCGPALFNQMVVEKLKCCIHPSNQLICRISSFSSIDGIQRNCLIHYLKFNGEMSMNPWLHWLMMSLYFTNMRSLLKSLERTHISPMLAIIGIINFINIQTDHPI